MSYLDTHPHKLDQRIEGVSIVRVIRVDYVAGAGPEAEPCARYARFYSEDGERLLADTRNGGMFSNGYRVEVSP